MDLKIEYVDIDTIKPYKGNAKEHPKEQIEQIKKSIQEFGFKDAVGVWKNEVVEGHGRLLAAKELGMKEIPIVRLDDLTDEQRKAYGLVHNQLTMNSGFDSEMLDLELDSLADFDMEQFGFDLSKDEKEELTEEEGEIPFPEVLGEEHNYVVLYFDNEVDWLQAQTLFDIKPTLALSTRKDGKITDSMRKKVIGRVVNGAKALEAIREAMK